MPEPDLLTAVQTELVTAGLARVPQDAHAADAPHPLYLSLRDATPAPGEKTGNEADGDLVMEARLAPGVPKRNYYGQWIREDGVEIIFRARLAWMAPQLEPEIRVALIDKRGWTMGGLRIIESKEWVPFQPLEFSPDAFSYRTSYLFEHYSLPE